MVSESLQVQAQSALTLGEVTDCTPPEVIVGQVARLGEGAPVPRGDQAEEGDPASSVPVAGHEDVAAPLGLQLHAGRRLCLSHLQVAAEQGQPG